MTIRNYAKKTLSVALALVMLLSVLTGVTGPAGAASAADYPAGVTYTASARVDESVGLRAEAGIGTAVGITPLDTRLDRPRAVMAAAGDSALQVTVTPYASYTLDQVVVAAIATIGHPSGTKEAVKSVQAFASGAFEYRVPDFSRYVKSGDSIHVEIVVYADLTYHVPADAEIDAYIDVATGAVTGPDTGGIAAGGRVITIDTAAAHGKTVKVTGAITGTNRQIYVRNSQKNAANAAQLRDIHFIFDNVEIYTGSATASNYKTVTGGTNPATTTVEASSANQLRTSGSTHGSAAQLIVSDADAYVTFTGTNILATGYTTMNGGSPDTSAIRVDASASLIVTDASTGSLYARGGGCSAAIGTGGQNRPSGYVEIDGGDITATSAHNSHAFSGIGNGGHYASDDPGTRGIVVNGGRLEALGFHYGLGANGGSSVAAGSYNAGVGRQYVVITGGDIVSEASAGSNGASIGFAFNNSEHEVRIGRPDKGDDGSSVFSVNWGFGAAISGEMTFYSGRTAAYSGQYAAAIGGNSVSSNTTSITAVTAGQSSATAMPGTPLTVYGGNVTAVAGAYTQERFVDYSISQIRGSGGERLSADAVLDKTITPRPDESYGAGIGGATRMDGGAENNIFAGTFNVTSSVYGAGIGGGGAYSASQRGGAGGSTWVGNLYDLDSGAVAPMSFTVTSGIYGAGIGGGGSGTGEAGAGGNLYISGGSFDITSGRFGAGIGGGGGGSDGGDGGNVVISGEKFDSFKVASGLYGAGIGGGGSDTGAGGTGGDVTIECVTDDMKVARWNGAGVTQSEYSFVITSGQFGAGIGGGGSAGSRAGDGAANLRITGGNFGITAGGSEMPGAYSTGEFGSYSYGAGIGGGGSAGGTGGNGPVNALVTGGYFNCFSEGYGAAIGGGGSAGGTGGNGGAASYQGGTVVVGVPQDPSTGESLLGSVGMGGGHSGQPAGSRIKDGEVTITGGNIYTEITSEVNGDPTQHARTLPNPGVPGAPPDDAYTTTTTAIKIETPKEEIGKKANQVAFLYDDSWWFEYAVDGLYITPGEDADSDGAADSGEAWIWVPTYLTLRYDLTSGRDAGDGAAVSDFDVDYASRRAVGNAYIRMDAVEYTYSYPGDVLPLLEWNHPIETDGRYVGATWGEMSPAGTYHTLGKKLYQLVAHDEADGYPVYLIGWAAQELLEDGGAEHIFDKDDQDWDYTRYLTDTASFQNTDVTVYAMWGYDKNLNGIPDVREEGYRLAYNGNAGLSAVSPLPENAGEFDTGESTNIAGAIPGRAAEERRVFLAWTRTPMAELGMDAEMPNYTDDGEADYVQFYLGGGSRTFGGVTVTGSDTVTFFDSDITLYALWAEDSNGNEIPDLLEAKRRLIHDGRGDAVTGVPADRVYVDGNTGVSGDGAGMRYYDAGSGTYHIFMGWTQDGGSPALLARSFTGTLPADLDNPLTLAAPFDGSDRTVYAVWAEDSNGNDIPDYQEGDYRFIYDTKTGQAVTGVPEDTNSYFENEYVDTGNDVRLAALTSGLEPYMEREGWVFLGWLEEELSGMDGLEEHDFTVGAANAYKADPAGGNGAFPEDALPFLSTVGGLPAFDDGDISVYAVWGVDANDTGIPDWRDEYGRSVQYVGIGSVQAGTMPFYNAATPDEYRDPADYAKGETAGVSDTIPRAPGKVFLGWSPVYHSNQVFGSSTATDKADFFRLLALMEDIPAGENRSGMNAVSYVGMPPPGTGLIGRAAYTLTPGLRPYYEAITGDTDAQLGDAYGGYDWYGFTAGTGFLRAVTFDSFDDTMTGIGGGAESNVWKLYSIWGDDINGNGDADIFEDRYALRYLRDVPNPTPGHEASGGPLPQNNNYPGQRTALNYTDIPGKLDSRNNALIFLGWTPEASVKEYYTAGDAALVPAIAGSVTFGNFDITVRAVWAEDLNQNGIPDVRELQYHLIYDANGGDPGSVPTDSGSYTYGDTAAVKTAPVPTHGSGYIFVYWTDDAAVRPSYGFGESAQLPARVTGVTFGTGKYTAANVSLYAVWSLDENGNDVPDVLEGPFTVTYNANGGINPPEDGAAYNYNDPVTVKGQEGMTNGGQVFAGWNTQEHGGGTAYSEGDTFRIQGDTTLYAQWAQEGEETYTVTYRANGGSGTPPSDSGRYLPGDTVTVPGGGGMTYSGRSFDGWNTQANGGGTSYAAGATFIMPEGNVTLYAKWRTGGNTGGGGGGGGGGEPTGQYTLTFEVNGGTPVASVTAAPGTVIPLDGYTSIRNGYTFEGWYSDAELTVRVTSVTLTRNMTVYAGWTLTEIPALLRTDHVAYIIGYPERGVSPNAPITRAEVATIFFRLLDEEARQEHATDVSGFSDVDGGVWYAAAVSTLAQLGILEGRGDGRFDGGAPITRAEFAAIAARLESGAYDGPNQFSDTDGHWARELISRAANRGWILGDGAGTFRPDSRITRAEAVTLINRVLQRQPQDSGDLLPDMKTWPDNMDTAQWYYLAFQEATNSHEYTRKPDGLYESWVRLTEDPDWQAYE